MQNKVAISFSKNHCYLTQFTQKKEGLSLTSVTSFSHSGDLLSTLSTNANIIRSFITNSTHVVLAISSQTVLLKTLLIEASLTDKEIIYHIQSQSQTLFGYAPEQLCFDYETYFIEENNQHIIIAAAHQQDISTYQHCFNNLKIPLTVIDTDVFALLRLTSFLTNDMDFILLFHLDDNLLIIVIQNGISKKIDVISLSSVKTEQVQLNSFLSIDEKIIVFNEHHALRTHLDELLITYQTVSISLLFDSIIQNKTNMSAHELYPFLISIGAGLWGNT